MTIMIRPIGVSDRELRDQVMDALDFDPLDPAAIGVTVSHGIVSLQGHVRSRQERWLAERVTNEVPGVRAIADGLIVDGDEGDSAADDASLAGAAVNSLRWHQVGQSGAIKVIVSDGWVTLTGQVADLHERAAAERILCSLRGVRGVANALTVIRDPDLVCA